MSRSRPRGFFRSKFLPHMAADEKRAFKAADFKRFCRGDTPSIHSALIYMANVGLVRRSGFGEYKITAAGRKMAKSVLKEAA